MSTALFFKPKLFKYLKTYSADAFVSDLIAGVVVGIVALPLAIAFGIASGVSPEKGLVTAVVAGFLVSALGGSRVQIGGPTGAFIVIVYGVVQKYGIDGLTVATLMAGLILVLIGLAGFGSAIKFVPHSVVVGFTSGIALIIFSSQVKDMLGLPIQTLPADFIEKWKTYLEHAGAANFYSLAICAGTVLLIVLWSRFFKRIPGSLVAILLSSAAVSIFHLPVETIGARFGELPHTLPMPRFPDFDWSTTQDLIQPAFTIALLAGIESLLSAVVADGMTGGKHRSNTELIAQGIANVGSALFGGIPATGAIARTATNVKNGARTPIAGILHALTLLAILFFFGKWAKLIPLACLAGILVVVSYHMSEWRSFASLLRAPKSDVLVLVLTFGLTVLVDLTVAIEVGMVLSAFLFMHRMSEVTQIRPVASSELDESEETGKGDEPERLDAPKGVEVFEINGPLFFGVTHEFEETMRIIEKSPKVRILRMRYVPFIDATGLKSLSQFHKRSRQQGTRLVLSGVREQPRQALEDSGVADIIGRENICSNIEEALERSRRLVVE